MHGGAGKGSSRRVVPQSRQFDGRLFRLPASATTLKKGDTIELHPVISAIHELETDPEEVTILAYSGEYNITRLPAIDDFATSPAAKVIRLDFQLPMQPLVKLKNDAGVTVKQVVWGYCKLWGRKPPPHFTNWDDTPCEDWIQTLEDHSGFPGFSPLKIRKDGSVVLGADARYFDS